MENPDKEAISLDKGKRLEEVRKSLGLTQAQMGERLETAQSNIGKYESGKRPIGRNVEYKIIERFGLNGQWWNTGSGDMFTKKKQSGNAASVTSEQIEYEELTYISTKARASFMELMDVTVEHESYWVLKSNPDESYADQVVIEIGGDSMEPNYWDGCKVRCKVVRDGDWIYLNSGVYAVAFGNFFVVKRVKNSPVNGILTLHSDNIETGGSTEVPLEKVRRIWRVLRIVDAPAR